MISRSKLSTIVSFQFENTHLLYTIYVHRSAMNNAHLGEFLAFMDFWDLEVDLFEMMAKNVCKWDEI